MFPLNSNDQYIDSNGKRSKLGDAIGSGGGSELPEHSEADAGKVLKVADDGSLEWDEAGGAGGVFVGLTDPDPLIGEDGDYYYKRSSGPFNWALQMAPQFYENHVSWGNEFIANDDFVITALYATSVLEQTVYMRIGSLTEVLGTTESGSITPYVQNRFALQNPVQIHKGDHFIVQVVFATSSRFYTCPNTFSGTDNIAEYVASYADDSSTYPGTAGTAKVGVSFEYQPNYELAIAQYIKQSNAWTRIITNNLT